MGPRNRGPRRVSAPDSVGRTRGALQSGLGTRRDRAECSPPYACRHLRTRIRARAWVACDPPIAAAPGGRGCVCADACTTTGLHGRWSTACGVQLCNDPPLRDHVAPSLPAFLEQRIQCRCEVVLVRTAEVWYYSSAPNCSVAKGSLPEYCQGPGPTGDGWMTLAPAA